MQVGFLLRAESLKRSERMTEMPKRTTNGDREETDLLSPFGRAQVGRAQEQENFPSIEASYHPVSAVNRDPENKCPDVVRVCGCIWWPGPGSNRRHTDFQSVALPTELPSLKSVEMVGAQGFEPWTQ